MSKRALALPAPGVPYHRLGRTPRTRWWRTLLGLLFLAAAFAIFALVAIGAGLVVHDPGLERAHGSDFDQAWRVVLVAGTLAAALPAVRLTAFWIDGRPPGTLSSAVGRIRWRWLGTCLLLTVAIGVIATCLSLLGGVDVDAGGVDLGLVAAVALASAALVPFQAAAEEYVFRGYLAQALGAYLRGPWIPAVLCSLLFGLAHGTVTEQGIWLFVDRAGFGLVAAWLVIRTGGLEAAVGLHAGLNVVGFVLSAVDGSIGTYFSSDEPPAAPGEVLLDLGLVTVAALLMLRLARRRDLQTVWAPPPPPPPAPAPAPAERPLRLW